MKKFFIFLGIATALVIFQTSFLAPWSATYHSPDPLLMFLIAGTAVFGFFLVWPWAVLGGIVLDIFSYARPATHVILFIISIYAVSFVSRRLLVQGWGPGVILAGLLLLPITLWNRIGFAFLEGSGLDGIGKISWGSIGWATLGNIFLFLIFLLIIRRFRSSFGPREYRIVRQ